MSQEVLFMFGVFILYFLVPLIPAVVIYKLFPDTKVSAKGPFSGLNINTTGAFSAYIIALISGIFIINNTIEVIKTYQKQKTEEIDFFWQVKSNLKIIEDDSVLVTNETSNQILDKIQVNLQPTPNWYRNSDDGYIVYVPNSLIKGNVTIAYTASQCETKKINPNSSNYKRDAERKEILIGNIYLRKTKRPINTYALSDTLTPVSPPQNAVLP